MPEKIIGTLTLGILKSIHTSISPITFYKSYSIATPGHPKPLLLENHARIVALMPDLQTVSFYSAVEFLYYSCTTELLSSLIYIKGSYPSSKTSPLLCGKSSSALWLLWRANSCKIATQSIPRVKATNDIWASAKQPRTSYNIYALGIKVNLWLEVRAVPGAPHLAY